MKVVLASGLPGEHRSPPVTYDDAAFTNGPWMTIEMLTCETVIPESYS